MKTLLKRLWLTLFIPTLVFAGDIENFARQMNDLYPSPTQEAFQTFQAQAKQLERKILTQDNNAGLLVALMIADMSQKHSWPIAGEGKIAALAREIIQGKSGLVKYIEDDQQIDPGKLDIWWCRYFSTGETTYLDKLLAYAGEEFPEKDIEKMLVIGSATWSFKSNCEQHPAVRNYARSQIQNPEYAHKKLFLKECAGIPPEEDFCWRNANGEPVPDSENRKTKDGFGAHLIITDNLGFYNDWRKWERPRISIAETAVIGQMVIPLVIYVNPRRDADECVDVTCDFTIIRPDGSIAHKIPDLTCANGKMQAPRNNLLLSQSELQWSADEGDPLGKWTFNVTVKDNNRGVEIPLTTSIEITE